MVHWPSRRALLTGLGTGVAALLAGCGGDSTSSSRDSPTATPQAGETQIDYSAEKTRSSGDRPPVVALSETDEATAGGDEQTATPDPTLSRTLTTAGDADAVEFAPEATNVAAVRRLLAETTYAEECVFVYQTTIQECYRLQLNYVSRDADGDPNLDFCNAIRDADTACEQGSRDYVATFVRLPFSGEEVGGYSIGRGSSCDPVPGERREGGSA